ncbi:hypothetical protein CsSME_00045574 [Camellia sinensis var. sinensis]
MFSVWSTTFEPNGLLLLTVGCKLDKDEKNIYGFLDHFYRTHKHRETANASHSIVGTQTPWEDQETGACCCIDLGCCTFKIWESVCTDFRDGVEGRAERKVSSCPVS